MNLGALASSLGLALLLAGAQVLFKYFASSKTGDGMSDLVRFMPLAGALALYFAVFVLYALVLKRYPLSLVYPTYTALSVILTYAAGIFIFREPPTLRAIIGIALLTVAVGLLSASGPDPRPPARVSV